MKMSIESSTRDIGSQGKRAVAIGGSAGAVEALRHLLPSLPEHFAAPVFVVVHIGADAQSNWANVFATCKLPICEAEDKEFATPGTIYFAPPGYHLLVDRTGVISLSVDEPLNLSRPSIDILFESAARAYGDGLLGILLSGANSDGASGMVAIQRAGGQCWVQSPDTASMPTMPRAALRVVPTARVLTLSQMTTAFQDA